MAVIIYSTTGTIDEAKTIARILVKEQYVACVHLIPHIESIYRWKGAIEEDAECVLLAKTTEENSEKTIQKIKDLHSYEVPEIFVLPISSGLPAYMQWVEDETK